VFPLSITERVATVCTNAADGPAAGAAAITADRAEVADAEPAPFVAVTTTCIVKPTSALVSAYAVPDATFVHVGVASHRCH
jgi:hypothetical protein